MAEFLPAIEYVLLNEGGYCDNPNDPGGATNFGILQRDWPEVQIASITRDQAIGWYEPNYWNKVPYSQLSSQEVATKLFDMHVNCGLSATVMIAQKALGFAAQNIDGQMGPMTLAAINSVNETSFLTEVVELLTLHYKLLEQKDPKLVTFDRGWCARAAKLPLAPVAPSLAASAV